MTRNEKAMLLLAGGGIGLWLLARSQALPKYSFANQVVFITGGSRGLGLVLARALHRQGARLAICARDADELARAHADLTNLGAVPLTCTADVTDAQQMRQAIAQAESALGPIDVLINNAGTIGVGPMTTMTSADFENSLNVHFWGAYHAVEAVLPTMRARKAGRIVNISSIGGKISVPHLLPYCVGKFALVGYSQGLRAELAPDGITVTTICPGLMRTGSPRQVMVKGNQAAEYAWFKVSDSLPLLAVSAETAAQEIIEACRRGDAEHVISLPAKLAVLANALAPELMANLIALADRLLPSARGAGVEATQGKALEPVAERLTFLTERAAQRNNEIDSHEEN
jgi:NAD(P)-dependent dehydrogenase (short-subunit alcohol dehydrogenase family)